MNAVAGASLLALAAPACPQCGEGMEACELEGHYGQKISTDLCPHCNLVWFDEFESVRLSGLGWVALLRRMQAAMEGGAGPMRPELDCPRCRLRLKPVQNLTRYGRFATLECPRRHGHLQTFSLLLSERGLVRPLGRLEFQTLQQEKRTPCCLNCGGPIAELAEECTYCASPLVVIDMPRFMTALLMRHAEPLPEETSEQVAWPCRGCGAPLAPSQMLRCDRCAHQVVVPSVLDLRPVLDKAEPLLRAALPREARPHGEKLRKMRGDHRATATHGILRHAWDMLTDDGGHPAAIPTWVGLVLLAAVIWFFWF